MNILDLEITDRPLGGRLPQWSPYQEAIFDQLSEPSPLLIQAVAGSGKTTTLVEAMRRSAGFGLFMAFNKSIAQDIAGRQPNGDVKTLNGLGHGLLMRHNRGLNLNARKNKELFDQYLSKEEMETMGYELQRVVGIAKNQCLGLPAHRAEHGLSSTFFPPSEEDFISIIEAYDFSIPPDYHFRAAEVCGLVLKDGIEQVESVGFDFDDQLYLPLLWGLEFPHYHNVFVDECQDLSPIQHAMMARLEDRGARLVCVGDRHQAIYGFRGAMTDSMDQLKTRFNMAELPLSVSYRCPTSVINEARRFCESILARDGAPTGAVYTTASDGEDPELWAKGLIMCRNNAPLFRTILRHVRAGRRIQVLSNFLESFGGFIKGFKCHRTLDLLRKLEEWQTKEIDAAERRGQRGRIAGIEDKYETVKLLCDQYQTVPEVVKLVKDLAESTSGPIFSTIHKAKGLESEDVHILRPDLLPSPWAFSPEAKKQEANLQYVAITRSKYNLTYGKRMERN